MRLVRWVLVVTLGEALGFTVPALWIPINIAAWLVGIAWTLAPSPVVDQSTPARDLILIYGLAGLCMAATVAVVTGVGMIRLLRAPIELDDRSHADQDGLMGSAEHIDSECRGRVLPRQAATSA